VIFNIFASFDEVEREFIRERIMAGLASVRAKGRIGGRKHGLSKESVVKANATLHLTQQNMPVTDIRKELTRIAH
jgi:DNA invertase Pin-like site-specific DNA recombinase